MLLGGIRNAGLRHAVAGRALRNAQLFEQRRPRRAGLIPFDFPVLVEPDPQFSECKVGQLRRALGDRDTPGVIHAPEQACGTSFVKAGDDDARVRGTGKVCRFGFNDCAGCCCTLWFASEGYDFDVCTAFIAVETVAVFQVYTASGWVVAICVLRIHRPCLRVSSPFWTSRRQVTGGPAVGGYLLTALKYET